MKTLIRIVGITAALVTSVSIFIFGSKTWWFFATDFLESALEQPDSNPFKSDFQLVMEFYAYSGSWLLLFGGVVILQAACIQLFVELSELMMEKSSSKPRRGSLATQRAVLEASASAGLRITASSTESDRGKC